MQEVCNAIPMAKGPWGPNRKSIVPAIDYFPSQGVEWTDWRVSGRFCTGNRASSSSGTLHWIKGGGGRTGGPQPVRDVDRGGIAPVMEGSGT